MAQSSRGASRYRERLSWPIWLWTLFILFDLSIALSFWAAFNDRVTYFIVLLLGIGTFLFSRSSALVIEISDEYLQVGRARIERVLIGEIVTLDNLAMRLQRGPQLDPAAFLGIRFWTPTGVRIAIEDSRDPTPYWLISTKAPEKLREALLRN